MSKTDGIGTWVWNEGVSANGQMCYIASYDSEISPIPNYLFSFTCDGASYIGLSAGYLGPMQEGVTVIEMKSTPMGGYYWVDQKYRTIDIKTAPPAEFLEILNANATYQEAKVTDLTGTTWVWNEHPAVDTQYAFNILFSSDNINFIDLTVSANTLWYTSADEELDVYSDRSWSFGIVYRTISITGGTDATNADLINYMYDNAKLQGSAAVSYPVTVNVTGGSVVGAAPATVNSGERFLITVDANAGYELPDSGVSVTGATFDRIAADTTRENPRYDVFFTNATGDVTIDLTLTAKVTSGTVITYNGATIATLSEGQTGTLACAGKKAVSDIAVAFGAAGTVGYNGTETTVEAGKTATLSCGGKKMVTDVVVEVSAGLRIVPWSTGTDDEIAAMVAALEDGTLSVEDTGWAFGDKRTVQLGAMAATGVGESHAAQAVELVLSHAGATAGITRADGKPIHFQVDQVHSLKETGYMNSSSTNSGSWDGCKRRTWCNAVYYNAIPEALRPIFKAMKVTTAETYNGSTLKESEDFFALRAEQEIFGTRKYSNTTEAAALEQIKWYKTADNRKKDVNGSAYSWWERSPRAGNSSYFCIVASNGDAIYDSATLTYGLAPFGCI